MIPPKLRLEIAKITNVTTIVTPSITSPVVSPSNAIGIIVIIKDAISFFLSFIIFIKGEFEPRDAEFPKLDNRTIEILALFGDVMKFSPEVSAKIISKLAEFIAREPIRNVDPLEEYLK